MKLAVLASGTGTNLQALLDRVHGRDGIEIVAVASDRVDAPALERARHAGVATMAFPAASHPNRAARDLAIADWLIAELNERRAKVVISQMPQRRSPSTRRSTNGVT